MALALLPVALAPLLVHAIPAERAAAPATVAPTQREATDLESKPAPPPSDARVVSAWPHGERVALDQPVRLGLQTSDGARPERVDVTVDPPCDLTRRWLADGRLELSPTRWRAGTVHRVNVTLHHRGAAAERVAWTFRTLVPAPLTVTNGEGRPIVLTFDDGPQDKRQAYALLDVLARFDAKVIFFPTGRWAKQRKDWVARAVREGHRVCNHSYSHRNLTLPPITEAQIRFEIENGASDGQCRLFRPPLMGVDGRVERIAKELGWEIYLWDFDSRDWEGIPAEDIENLVLANAAPGKVLLFHTHARGTAEALPKILPRLLEAGYRLTHEAETDVGAGAMPVPPSLAPAPDPLLD